MDEPSDWGSELQQIGVAATRVASSADRYIRSPAVIGARIRVSRLSFLQRLNGDAAEHNFSGEGKEQMVQIDSLSAHQLDQKL